MKVGLKNLKKNSRKFYRSKDNHLAPFFKGELLKRKFI